MLISFQEVHIQGRHALMIFEGARGGGCLGHACVVTHSSHGNTV